LRRRAAASRTPGAAGHHGGDANAPAAQTAPLAGGADVPVLRRPAQAGGARRAADRPRAGVRRGSAGPADRRGAARRYDYAGDPEAIDEAVRCAGALLHAGELPPIQAATRECLDLAFD
jgi:hypothetical protein